MKKMHLCNDSMRHNWHVAWRQLFSLCIRAASVCIRVWQCVAVQRKAHHINTIIRQAKTHTHTRLSMWLLRVVLLDRHNIWDVHGCRSHTNILPAILLYLLHSAYKNYRFDLKTGIHCIWPNKWERTEKNHQSG